MHFPLRRATLEVFRTPPDVWTIRLGTLYTIAYSPWSEKARWSLDATGIQYHEQPFLPLLGEATIRWRARKWSGRVTVPAWVSKRATVIDSFEIAKWADAQTESVSLIPEDDAAAIASWNQRSEACLEAARVLVTARVQEQSGAGSEMVPPPLNRLGPLTSVLARTGSHYLRWKYRFNLREIDAARGCIREHLGALRAQVGNVRQTILQEFSFADIAMAATLQCVVPVHDRFWRIGPHVRECWRDPELAREFGDLVRWRDTIYEMYR